ncbi:MAG: Cof-type HAD-IIB family hydrolase, partial [Symbiobacteriaceae bacterium]|nr:Cof-type HAD-IIB family hydrolase [Symbiobacteriaceae bacterium]
MPVRLIVTDLDGTLLRNDKTISAQSVSVLTQCREAGIKVVFATGRGSNASDMVVVSNSHFDGRVVGNGATAFIGDNIVYRKLLSCSSVRSLLIACDAGGLKTASQLDDRDYTNFICSDVWPEHVDFEIVDFAQHDKDAEKVYVLTNSPTDVALITQHLSMEMYLVVDRVGFAMIMHREATKAAAVAELAR